MKKPIIHFSPVKNWMNDPNGTIYKNGVYHLFYQYNPNGCEWGDIQWAYATSDDLINWERKGLRLTPDASIGERYCFSGCCIDTPYGIKSFYTSIGFEEWAIQHHAKQRICDVDEGFDAFKRNGSEITADIHGFEVSEWRDPFVFYVENKAYMVMAGIGNGKSNVFLYVAKDKKLNEWQFVDSIYSIEESEDIIECPNVAVFGNKILLIYSMMKANDVRYVCGDFNGKNLDVKKQGYIDYGYNCYYATNLAKNVDGNYILFGWLKESLIGSPSPDGVYSGCLALPKVLLLRDYTPEFYHVNALYSLYDGELNRDSEGINIKGDNERFMLTFKVSGNETVELLKNETEGVTLNFENDTLKIERKSEFERAETVPLTAYLGGGDKEVSIVVDGTAIEVLVNNLSAISFRHYGLNPSKYTVFSDGKYISDFRAIQLSSAKLIGE